MSPDENLRITGTIVLFQSVAPKRISDKAICL